MGVYTGTLPGAFAVERLRASELEEIRQAVTALNDARSTWTLSAVNWAAGTGGGAVLEGRHTMVGKFCVWRLRFVFGTAGGSVGTGPTFDLPATPHSSYAANAKMGSGLAIDASTAARVILEPILSTGSTVSFPYWSAINSLAQITAAAPWGWAAGDTADMSGIFEVA